MDCTKNLSILIFTLLILILRHFTHALWFPESSLSVQSKQISVTNDLDPVVLAPGVNVEVWHYCVQFKQVK